MSAFDFEKYIVDLPDYPQPGVTFKDITPLLGDGEAFATAVNTIAEHFQGKGVTKVLGTEARGFMFAAPVACALGVGFVPARKPGKLPRETIGASYELEYGTDRLEIHTDALTSEDKVLIVDDLIATGGTAGAAANLAQTAGAEIAGFGFLMELDFCNPRPTLAQYSDAEVYSLVHVQ